MEKNDLGIYSAVGFRIGPINSSARASKDRSIAEKSDSALKTCCSDMN